MTTDDLSFTEEELQSDFIEGPEIPGAEEEFDEPDAGFVSSRRRPAKALVYERKVKKGLNSLFRETVQHEATVPDAAAIIMYGPKFAEKAGDLADADKRVARAVDWIMEGTENPYLAFAFAGMPLILQLYRNHQDHIAPSAIVKTVKESRAAAKERPGRTFRIPFTKRTITIRFKFAGVEQLTNEPQQLAAYVFTNPKILAAIDKAQITPAFTIVRPGDNGNPAGSPARSRSRKSPNS